MELARGLVSQQGAAAIECRTKDEQIGRLELRISELERELQESRAPLQPNGDAEESIVAKDKIISSSISVSVVKTTAALEDGEKESEEGCVVAEVAKAIATPAVAAAPEWVFFIVNSFPSLWSSLVLSVALGFFKKAHQHACTY